MNESIVCPFCFHESFHPEDIKQEYCGFCHTFILDELLRRRQLREAEDVQETTGKVQ